MFAKRHILAIVAALVLAVVAPAFAANEQPLMKTNGYVVVRNSLDSKVSVSIYLSGDHEDRDIFPKNEVLFNRFCCYVAGTTYLVRVRHVIDDDQSVLNVGKDSTVKPRLCTDKGLLFGYAHMTVVSTPAGTIAHQDDTGCP